MSGVLIKNTIKMNNIIINNFFSTEEISYFKDLLINEKNIRTTEFTMHGRHLQSNDPSKMYIKQNLSRLNIYDLKINYSIKNKILDTALILYEGKKTLDKDSIVVNYCRYSPEYSTILPRLGSHKDMGDFTFILDYQLHSNIDWDIIIEDNLFLLKNNDLLSFYPTLQQHSRPEIDWNDDSFVEMLFFEFKEINKKAGSNN
jgi:hypothetical protein